MSNLPPCGACSYAPVTETLSIFISSTFIGALSNGLLTLRSDTGATVTHNVPARLSAGQSVVLTGLRKPNGSTVDLATMAWVVSGDPQGFTSTEAPISVV